MTDFQEQKTFILSYFSEFDGADDKASVLDRFVVDDYLWRGMHPFYEQQGAAEVVENFWAPLCQSLTSLQRRQDVFMAGNNDARKAPISDQQEQWVCSMGHFMGLFDKNWLGIPATGKIAMLPYAEFHKVVVENSHFKIAESALFIDIVSLMQQVGWQPLPMQTGSSILRPSPKTHDGLLFKPQQPSESEKTLSLINRMIADLSKLNESGNDRCPPELLAQTWHHDMAWYGPAGIGSTYTIERYQHQHQYPFRTNLKDKVFNGHICRLAEGNYAGFFGWANLTNTSTGGFLGMTGNQTRADMRVVDIYRRDGDKLAENWVFIDLLHYLSMQGLNVLERMRDIHRT